MNSAKAVRHPCGLHQTPFGIIARTQSIHSLIMIKLQSRRLVPPIIHSTVINSHQLSPTPLECPSSLIYMATNSSMTPVWWSNCSFRHTELTHFNGLNTKPLAFLINLYQRQLGLKTPIAMPDSFPITVCVSEENRYFSLAKTRCGNLIILPIANVLWVIL